MQQHHSEFEARGVRVLAIGQGTGREAGKVCRGVGTDFACYGDPGRDAYRAFEFPRADWWSVTAKPFFENPSLAFRRIRKANLEGTLMPHTDVLQLPGVVIVDGTGVVRYLHRSKKTDDLPAAAEIFRQLDRLPRITPAN